MKEKKQSHLIDIHTHHRNAAQSGRAIVSFSMHDLVAHGKDVISTDAFSCVSSSFFHEEGWYSIGFHPWYLSEDTLTVQLEALSRLLLDERVVAIGEGGLDRLATYPMDFQLQVFEAQVALSEQYQLPFIIHCVKAMEEIIAVRKRLKPKQPWIWHGFRGKVEQAKQLLKLGFYLSFGAHYADESLRIVPADRLFLETDESELSIEMILQRAAQVRGVGQEELRATLQRNVRYIFFKT